MAFFSGEVIQNAKKFLNYKKKKKKGCEIDV
jgi:hypothetical protein